MTTIVSPTNAPVEPFYGDVDHLSKEGWTHTACGLPNRGPLYDAPRFDHLCVVCLDIAWASGVRYDRMGRPLPCPR